MGRSVAIFFSLLVFFICETAMPVFAQENTVSILVVLKDAKTKQPISDARAKVFQQVSFSFLIPGDNPGEFYYRMDYNKECLFGFYKTGYIIKSISLSTKIDAKLESKLLPEYKFDVLLSPGTTTDEDVSNPKLRFEWNPKDLSKFTETTFDLDKLADNEKMLQAMNLFLDNYYKEKNKAKAAENVSFEEKMRQKVEEENAKLRAELEKLKQEAAQKEQEEAETQLALAQAEENKRVIEEIKRKNKESEERLKLAQNAEERLRMEKEEKIRLNAEIERLAKENEEKKKLELELAATKKQAAADKAKLDAAERARADAEFARREAEEVAKKKGSASSTTKKPAANTLSSAEAKKKAEADAKAKQEAEAMLRIKAEQMKKEEEEKERLLALAMANDEKVKMEKEAEMREREKEAAVISSEDCGTALFLDRCRKRLGDYSFVQSFKIENEFNSKPEGIKYNIVCTKDAHYMLTVCQGLGGRMIVTIYDNAKKIVATSFNKKTKKHLSKIDFVADKTGVYYFNFAFESEIGCGISVLGVKK